MFSDEKSLVNHFVSSIQADTSPWGDMKLAQEFFYQRGRTDLVAISPSGDVIAFEAKLSKWRTALQQAYRNLCFADMSFVILPEDSAKNAVKHIDEFSHRGVGLCCFVNDDWEILVDAPRVQPLQPWLREQAIQYVKKEELNNECHS